MLFCFVSVRDSNYFMTELLAMIAAAVSDAGHQVDFAFDEFPELPADGVYVVIPHEFHGMVPAHSFPTRAQCRRTLALCTENPGTSWFEGTCPLLPHFGATLTINRSSAAELRRRGIPCEHLQLGYSSLWDSWRRDETVTRPVDILYLGARDARRDALLAGYGRHLWHRRCQFLVPALEFRAVPSPDYLIGPEKHARLRSSQLLINLHRAGSRSFEWVRFLEAACNGCVVLSEDCIDPQPLVPGEHFIAASAGSVPLLADHLLDDPDELRRIALTAYDYIRDALPMGSSVARMATLAADALARATAHPPMPADRVTPLPQPDPLAPPIPLTPEQERLERQGAALRSLSIATRKLGRELAALSDRSQADMSTGPEVVTRTPAYEDPAPRVSVLVTLHNQETEVVDALSSIARSSFGAFEVLILDDDSIDGSKDAAERFLEDHPWLPAILLHQPVTRGRVHSRNELVRRARGESLFILDADNGIYPPALERLVAALDADPEAAFAYAMIAVYEAGRPVGLVSRFPWNPARLRIDAVIDATVLIRRQELLRVGGYVTDLRLAGSEDLDLWCRCAETGLRGVLVPQVLAWHRRPHQAMPLFDLLAGPSQPPARVQT